MGKSRKGNLQWVPDGSVKLKISELWDSLENSLSCEGISRESKKRKWDQAKIESIKILKNSQAYGTNNPWRKTSKTKEVTRSKRLSNPHPPTNDGEVRIMGSAHHNCPVNVLLAALFGKYTADRVNSYQANTRIAWKFRLFLANQLPKTGTLGETSVEDWRRALIMMYEGALFNPEEFQSGVLGKGLNLSIKEFKKLQQSRQNDWITEVQGSSRSKSEESKIKKLLKDTNQWEDWKQQHWAFAARVLNIEINFRTSKSQKNWYTISPYEFYPMVEIPVTPLKHNKRIYIENLQEGGGWHFNLIVDPKDQDRALSESHFHENLDVKLTDGRSFRTLFWPRLKRVEIASSIKSPKRNRCKLNKIEPWSFGRGRVKESLNNTNKELSESHWTKVSNKKVFKRKIKKATKTDTKPNFFSILNSEDVAQQNTRMEIKTPKKTDKLVTNVEYSEKETLRYKS